MARVPNLPQVTLVAVSGVAIEATVAALRRSAAQAAFGRVLLLSDRAPRGEAAAGIDWRRIHPLRRRADYSRFILAELAGHIETSHALIVQWDGFVRDGSRWQPAFLDHDYIGAPWPQFGADGNVGNGGFSLRSRRLLEATRALPATDGAEDVTICRTHRGWLEDRHGIRFAPEPVARAFAYERGTPSGTEFGFHGVFNMTREIAIDELRALLASLEPGVVGERETTELLVWALRHRLPSLLVTLLRQHSAHPRRLRRLLRGLGWYARGLTGAPGGARIVELK